MQKDEIFEHIRSRYPQVLRDEQPAMAIALPGELLLNVVDYLKTGELLFDNLHCVTAVDRKERIELIYILYSLRMRHQVILKVHLPIDDPKIESLTKLYKSADWFEREVYDLFGVRFLNHPDLSRILNPDDWEGYPLRKDYTHPSMVRKPRN